MFPNLTLKHVDFTNGLTSIRKRVPKGECSTLRQACNLFGFTIYVSADSVMENDGTVPIDIVNTGITRPRHDKFDSAQAFVHHIDLFQEDVQDHLINNLAWGLPSQTFDAFESLLVDRLVKTRVDLYKVAPHLRLKFIIALS